MSFAVASALVFGCVGAVLALTSLAPSAVALAAFGLALAWRARRRAKFMNEPTQMPTTAVVLNVLSLALAGIAVAQFGAAFAWLARKDADTSPPQTYDFRATLEKAIAPLHDLGPPDAAPVRSATDRSTTP